MHVEFVPPDKASEATVKIAKTIDVDGFYDYYVQQLKTLEFKGIPG